MLQLQSPNSHKPPISPASTNGLQQALESFQNSLGPAHRDKLQAIQATPDAKAVLQFTAELDTENARRQSRCVASRVMKLLESVQQFSQVVDTFVSSNPRTAGLVWGSVKLVLQVASNFSTYFEKLSTFFMKIGRFCPRYAEYQVLYMSSTDLQRALCDFYSAVVRCCQQAVKVVTRSGYTHLLRSLIASFESDFASFEVEIRQCSKDVKEAISLAEAKCGNSERQLQVIDREENQKYRLSGYFFREQTSKSLAARKAQLDIERQRIHRQSLINQLTDHNQMIAFKRASQQRVGDTCSWLSRTDEHTNWAAQKQPCVLWLEGKLGSGKTVLSAYAIQQLTQENTGAPHQVAYFFCQHDDANSLKAETLLGSLIKQCLRPDDIPTDVEACLENLLRSGPLDIRDLETLLITLVKISGPIYMFVDGLDECADSTIKQCLKVFRHAIDQKSTSLKLFLAGRDRITDTVKASFGSVYTISTYALDARNALDILIKQLITLKKQDQELVVGDVKLYDEILMSLSKGAQGMILWAVLQLEDICCQTCDEDIREVMEDLPPDLPHTYNRLLSRINKEDGRTKLATKAFRWMATARRPLSPDELREAIAIEPCQPYLRRDKMINDHFGIIRWCHGLVTLDQEEGVLQFVHSSVKDFLLDTSVNHGILSEYHFRPEDANSDVGDICVTYLNFNNFKAEIIKAPKRPVELDPFVIADLALGTISTNFMPHRLKKYLMNTGSGTVDSTLLSAHLPRPAIDKYSLLSYASTFWLHHSTDISEKKPAIWSLWKHLALGKSRVVELPWTDNEGLIRYMFANHHHALRQLVISDIHLSEREAKLCLFNAVRHDQLGIMEAKLERHDFSRDKWLNIAAMSSNIPIMEALLKTGIEVDTQDDTGLTALHVAAGVGTIASVEFLLAAGASIDILDHEARTALYYAEHRSSLTRPHICRMLSRRSD